MRIVGILCSAALITAGFVRPEPVKAWGQFGHLTVCDLAYRNLTATSKAAVKKLLNSTSGGITIPASPGNEARHYTSFNVGCLEEDSRPKKHPKDHFINVDRGLATIAGDSCPLNQSGQPTECIFEGLKRDLLILKDTSETQQRRVIALMAIGHWIGDIHQPLHISYADDVGGNNINVSYSGPCGTSESGNPYHPKNLHSVWDNCLLESGLFQRVRERADFKTSWSRFTITYRGVDTLLARTGLADEVTMVSTQPWQWAAESYQITRDPAVKYCFLVSGKCQFTPTQLLYSESPVRKETIDAAYRNQFKLVVEDRVRKAGFRLAHLLNMALDPGYMGPIKNSGQPD